MSSREKLVSSDVKESELSASASYHTTYALFSNADTCAV